MEEILSMAYREIGRTGAGDNLTAGMVLTGGGALLAGAAELAEQIFDAPARLGQIQRIAATGEDLNNNRFATAHGLLAHGFLHEPVPAGRRGGLRGWLTRFEDWIQKQF